MFVNHAMSETAVNIVLHGAPGSGRSTTRDCLARMLPPMRGRLDDFAENPPLRFPTPLVRSGYPLAAYIWDGAPLHDRIDVVVFVFDLAPTRRDVNVAAIAELRAGPEVPWVLQLNKCDLVDRMSLADAVALAGGSPSATIETCARDGTGVDRVIAAAIDAIRA